MPTTSRPHAVATEQIRRRLARMGGTSTAADVGSDHRTADDEAGAGAPGPGDVPPGPPRRGPRIEPGRPGLLLLCAVALVAAAVSALLTWAGRPDSSPVPVAAVVSPGLPAEDEGATGVPETAGVATPTTPASVVVAVVGAVVTPGLVTLPLGSRVADAVAAAGGARPGADLSTVNLARVLVDGEQIAVGVPGAPLPPGIPGGAPTGGPALVDLNTATEAELEDLPGVGPVLAGRIVAYRDDNGGFTAVEELQEVSGIGPSTYAELEDAVTV